MSVRRLVQAVTALALAAAPVALVTAAAPAQAGPAYNVSVPSRFSPNGDGVQDTLRVRFTVPKPTRVRLEISGAGRGSSGRTIAAVDLGWKKRGTYAWAWDGRKANGRRVGDGLYYVRLAVPSGTGRAADRFLVDTTFEPELTTPAYGLEVPRPRVFPRSTEVTDAVELTAFTREKRLSSMRLVIRDARGKVVRDADVDDELLNDAGYRYGYGRTVAWAAQRGGAALPPGRYTAVVTGRDRAGNLGTSDPMRIWVSADRLVWKEVTTTLTPVGSAYADPCLGSGCGDYQPCGSVVPSALFAEGLSYRSVECTGQFRYPLASRSHQLLVPEATGVRGVAEARVGFTGAPTSAGESDTGELGVWTSDGSDVVVRGSTGAETGWVDDLGGGSGRSVEDYDGNAVLVPPGVQWSFTTRGSDSVDVDRFTVTYRYAVVE